MDRIGQTRTEDKLFMGEDISKPGMIIQIFEQCREFGRMVPQVWTRNKHVTRKTRKRVSVLINKLSLVYSEQARIIRDETDP